MTMSEMLLLALLGWSAIIFGGVYWAEHTTMFDDDDDDELPEQK